MCRFAITAACFLACAVAAAEDASRSPAPPTSGLSLVVMDPLAAPLSCPCVEGYAQRQYDKLAEFLSEQLARPVRVTFAESFEKALAKEGCDAIDIAIGKDSVVRYDAAKANMDVTPIAQLTGKDGLKTQTGLIVVRSADPAQTIEDLRGYRILFGTVECDEKFDAARVLLASAGVEMPAVGKSETMVSCSDGACKIIEWGDSERAAAVISSYAAPLLEGCGTIKKGDLRVVDETEPVPFITAFTTERIDEASREEIRDALLAVGENFELKTALETLIGFVAIDDDYLAQQTELAEAAAEAAKATEALDANVEKAGALKSGQQRTESAGPEQPSHAQHSGLSPPAAEAALGWPGWRGPTRDGRVTWLPSALPTEPEIMWRVPLHRAGLGGIAATSELVLFGDRDVSNMLDEFHCHAADTGELLWSVRYPAPGKLDYDNTPRATPLIHEGYVYLLGAFGALSCVELETGLMVWQVNLIDDFDGEQEMVWGVASSPLIVDGKLIVNPGGAQASLVALDPLTGDPLWESPGERHAYASFIVAQLGGLRQLVGYDRTTLGGWHVATGRRLWTLKPPHSGDFNVPTPVAVDGRLLATTENNGTRLFRFSSDGKIIAEPEAANDRLAPDISTPVVVGNRLFCVCVDMFCLDLTNGLAPIWVGEDKAFCEYSPLIASENRVLALGRGGELILVDATADEFRVVSRSHLFTDRQAREVEILSHPAIVGTRLFLRGAKELVCVDLGAQGG